MTDGDQGVDPELETYGGRGDVGRGFDPRDGDGCRRNPWLGRLTVRKEGRSLLRGFGLFGGRDRPGSENLIVGCADADTGKMGTGVRDIQNLIFREG